MHRSCRGRPVGDAPTTVRRLVSRSRLGYSLSSHLTGDREASNADVAQLVEHHLAKVRVAGSNPVVRSERVSPTPLGRSSSPVEWPRGEATDCKSVYTGSNPVSTSGDWRSGSALP